MLNAIIGFSIRNKLIIGLMVLGLITLGIYELTRLPIDAVPDITNNQVQVITVAPSYGATDIERLVTFPVEQATGNIPGVTEIRSFSRFGLSLVTIVFNDNTDVYWARQQVAEKLQQVKEQIPAGIGMPELGPVTTGLGEIYQYTVRPARGFEDKYTETELRTIQDWVIRRQLLRVSGVAEVSSFGGKLKQYSIEVMPDRLNSFGLTISDLFHALEANNQNTGGAYIEKTSTVLYIRSEGLLKDTTDIGAIPVKSLSNGTPVLIRDVATVKIGHATRYGAITYNDEGEVAGAVVMMLKGANSGRVIKDVKARMDEIRKTLPKGIIVEPFLDRTKMVNNAIHTVEKNLIEGALIVIFVLVVFLGNLRAGLLVASVIPLSMLFAVIMMNAFGVSGNLMSLGAIDFGLIVDGAVIIVEAVLHHVHGYMKRSGSAGFRMDEMNSEVKRTAGKMMNSAVFGQVIILIVYLPIFTLESIEGKMFRPMAETVAFALVGAFLLSLTWIPMMSTLVISRKGGHKQNLSDRIMASLENRYRSSLTKVLHRPALVIAALSILVTAAIVIATQLGGEFIPTLEEGDFAVETRVLTGSNLKTTIAATTKVAHILKKRFPEVEQIVAKAGSGEVPTDPMPMEACDLMIILKDKSKWVSAHNFNELAEKMSKAAAEVPGVTTSFQYPVQMRFNELMTGAKQDVVCKIYGDDLDTLANYAARLGAIAGQVKGAANLYVEPVEGIPQLLINYNRQALAQFGVSVEQVNDVVNAAFAGRRAGMLFDGDRRFDIVVRLAGGDRKNIDDVRNLLVSTNSGRQVPLSQLAEVNIQDAPYQVQREDGRRRIIVGFNVRGRDVQSAVTDLQKQVESKLKLPVGYSVTYGGVFENLHAARQRLAIATPIALLLIFLMLFFAFRSLKQAALIFTAVPLSAVGGLFLLAARGLPFSISAGVGFIALFGVAVLNGIVLISEFNRLKEETDQPLEKLILTGASNRLRPVLMTAFVASLGFLPMALSNGAGAEVQRPLATVVIGGLLLATFLTLFALPLLYSLLERRLKTAKVSGIASVALFLILLPAFTQAQQYISIKDAIDTAVANNLRLKNDRLTADYRERLIKTATLLPSTTIAAEYGQINSIYNDNRFTVAQGITFPTIYNRQKQVLREEWKESLLIARLSEKELARQVAATFYEYQHLTGKLALLRYADSLFDQVKERAAIRMEKGESDLLEKASAENQWAQVHLQLNAAQTDSALILMRFRMLLNTSLPLVPDTSRIGEPTMVIDGAFVQHPLAAVLTKRQQLSLAQLRLERSRLLPEINLAYNNGTIRGVGADERYYGVNRRFNSAQLGIGIPVFASPYKHRIAAARLSLESATITLDAGMQELRNGYNAAFAQYNRKKEAVAYYQKSGLENAITVTRVANQRFMNGEINYLTWTMLINQALLTRSEYLDAVNALNNAIIELQYYN